MTGQDDMSFWRFSLERCHDLDEVVFVLANPGNVLRRATRTAMTPSDTMPAIIRPRLADFVWGGFAGGKASDMKLGPINLS